MHERVRQSVFTFALCALYCVTLVIGIWHAFPNMDVSHDEATYIWDAVFQLRDGKLTPSIEAAYTISYYLNFIPIALIGLLVFKGDFSQLSQHIMLESIATWGIFLIPRLISVIAGVLLLWFFLMHARSLHSPKLQSLAVIVLLFTNILFSVIAHTGKMWMVSILLFFLSYFFLAESYLHVEELKGKAWFRSPVMYSIVFTFLSFANFPLNGIALVNLFYLYYILKKRGVSFHHISRPYLLGVLIGVTALALLLILNWQGWHTQGTSLLLSASKVLDTYWEYVVKGILFTMPLLLINIANIRRITHKPLFMVLVSYFVLFSIAIAIVATGVGTQPAYYYRYLLIPIVIVGLMLLLAEFRSPKVLMFTALISLLFFIQTLRLLTAPTTYNHMLTQIQQMEWAQSILVNQVPEVDLFWLKNERGDTMNVLEAKQSMSMERIHARMAPLMKQSSKLKAVYLITDTKHNYPLVYSVSNGSSKDTYYATIDDNLGPYTFKYFTLQRLGEPLYLYRILENS